MLTATWSSFKSSPVMSEIRERLKKKANKGEATLSNKEANRTWREEILGNLSEEQKKQNKQNKKEANRTWREEMLGNISEEQKKQNKQKRQQQSRKNSSEEV